MARKYCPDCTSILSSIILLSSFDVPNDLRTNTYFCSQCSNKLKMLVVFCFSYTKLPEFKQKGKFPSAVKYTKKLVNYLKSKNQSFLCDNKIPKKWCPYCKESLNYDENGSKLKEDNAKIHCFFHFDCKNNDHRQLMFFFVSQEIKSCIRVNRVVIG